jgi:hypothetical protein
MLSSDACYSFLTVTHMVGRPAEFAADPSPALMVPTAKTDHPCVLPAGHRGDHRANVEGDFHPFSDRQATR